MDNLLIVLIIAAVFVPTLASLASNSHRVLIVLIIASVFVPVIVYFAIDNARNKKKPAKKKTEQPKPSVDKPKPSVDKDPVRRKVEDMFNMLDQLKLGEFSRQGKQDVKRQPPISAISIAAKRKAIIDNIRRNEGDDGTAREDVRRGLRNDQRSKRRDELQGDRRAHDDNRVSNEPLIGSELRREGDAKVCDQDMQRERNEPDGR